MLHNEDAAPISAVKRAQDEPASYYGSEDGGTGSDAGDDGEEVAAQLPHAVPKHAAPQATFKDDTVLPQGKVRRPLVLSAGQL